LVVYGIDPALLPGGYAGVDVLFVVAGYLAARMLFADEGGGRALAGFYARLVRRAAPAVLAMLAVVSAAVWLLWPAQAFADYSLTLAASAVFLANFAFAVFADFFGPIARATPLLHLWAVAVAAQVLLAVGLICVAGRSLAPAYLRMILIVLTVLSYWSGVWLEVSAPERAWYMPQARAWEVLIGVLLVFGELPGMASRIGRAALAALGLAAIAAVFAAYGDGLRQPGLATMIPVVAAAAVIYAGGSGGNPVSALLDVRPLAAVGAAAFSIYLWHWPVLVIARSLSPGVAATLGALAVVAVASALSHRFLEQPYRGGRGGGWRPVALSFAGILALIGVAALGVFS
jgi:peptidoglycan/LPS O-acetylase OafA/YrhL